MPGPCNNKRKKKNQAKKAKRTKAQKENPTEQPEPVTEVKSRTPSPTARTPIQHIQSPQSKPRKPYKPLRSQPIRFEAAPLPTHHVPIHHATPSPPTTPPHPQTITHEPQKDIFDSVLQRPCVEDLGNGPHVRDISAFLESRIAAPPSLDDPLCAEFAQREVLEMLCSVLPEEMAMIMWYNKSRLKSRVCPACKRLYHLGDATKEPLVDSLEDEDLMDSKDMETDQPRRRQSEQRISGICSALCFILVAFHYPAAIRSTWGRMAEELSDEIWDELDGPGLGDKPDTMGLSMMLKMTRCHDLGLSQLFFPGQEMDGEEEAANSSEDSDSHRTQPVTT